MKQDKDPIVSQQTTKGKNNLLILLGSIILILVIVIIFMFRKDKNNSAIIIPSDTLKTIQSKQDLKTKPYKLKLGSMYVQSATSLSAYWFFTNTSSEFIDEITIDAYYSCCAVSAFKIKFRNVAPGKKVGAEDFLKGSGRLSVLAINEVKLEMLRFMVNGQNVLDAKNQIEIEPNKYERKIYFK